jgi:hypothetical protein
MRQVDIDAAFFPLNAAAVFVDFAFAVQETEEVLGAVEPFELLIAGAIQHAFAVGDIGRIGDLGAGDRKLRAVGTQAPETDQHRAALCSFRLSIARSLLRLSGDSLSSRTFFISDI